MSFVEQTIDLSLGLLSVQRIAIPGQDQPRFCVADLDASEVSRVDSTLSGLPEDESVPISPISDANDVRTIEFHGDPRA